MSDQLFPDVIDGSTLGALFSESLFMPIAVEGEMGSSGAATVKQLQTIQRPSDSQTAFGAGSSLDNIVQFLLGRGISPVYAIASSKATPPTILQREAAWAVLEPLQNIRLRLTDDVTLATLAALGTSCQNADLLNNKQVAFGGLATGLTKSTYISACETLNNNRFVLVCPGVFDNNGNLLTGAYAAAAAAADVALNSDISDDLNLDVLQNLSGIETDANLQPLFLERVISGVVVNDFEDILQAGGSPLMTDRSGLGVRITHLRMTWTGATPESDYSYDSLMTRLIVDQIFLDVRSYCYDNNFLDKGNTQVVRDALSAGITALLLARNNWIQPVTQSDGTLGYNVSVTSSNDQRSVIISYNGVVVRGIATILVDANLSIPV